MNFNVTEPCDACPFLRTNGFAFKRLVEFAAEGTFPCHKTCKVDDETGTYEPRGPKTLVCAGMLIFNEKRGTPNQMMRIAERLRMYDRRKLKMDSDVGSSPHHYRRGQRR